MIAPNTANHHYVEKPITQMGTKNPPSSVLPAATNWILSVTISPYVVNVTRVHGWVFSRLIKPRSKLYIAAFTRLQFTYSFSFLICDILRPSVYSENPINAHIIWTPRIGMVCIPRIICRVSSVASSLQSLSFPYFQRPLGATLLVCIGTRATSPR